MSGAGKGRRRGHAGVLHPLGSLPPAIEPPYKRATTARRGCGEPATPRELLGAVLAEYRISVGMGVKEYAQVTGRSSGCISQREHGRGQIPLDELFMGLGDEAATHIIETFRERLREAGSLKP